MTTMARRITPRALGSAAAACLTIVVALRFGHAPVAASAPQAGPVWTVVPAPTGVSKGMADQTHETTGGRFGAVWKEGDKVLLQTKIKETGKVVINNAYVMPKPEGKL
mgnify:CR=1 FL=1